MELLNGLSKVPLSQSSCYWFLPATSTKWSHVNKVTVFANIADMQVDFFFHTVLHCLCHNHPFCLVNLQWAGDVFFALVSLLYCLRLCWHTIILNIIVLMRIRCEIDGCTKKYGKVNSLTKHVRTAHRKFWFCTSPIDSGGEPSIFECMYWAV